MDREAEDAVAEQRAEEAHGSVSAPLRRVVSHHLQVGAHSPGQVGLVDDQQIGAGDSRAALAGHLVAARDVDNEGLVVDESAAEGGGEVVAAAFDEHQVQGRKGAFQVFDGFDVGGDVVPYGGVRTAAGLDGAHPLGGDDAVVGGSRVRAVWLRPGGF